MDQKKTLWIVAAAGIFLLVVVGAALVLYSPVSRNEQNVQSVYKAQDGWIVSPPPSVSAGNLSGVAPMQGQTDSVPPLKAGNFETPENFSAAAANGTESVPGVPPDFSGDVPPQNQMFVSGTDLNQPMKVENVTVISDNAVVYGKNDMTTIDLNALKSSPVVETVVPKNELTKSKMNAVSKSENTETEVPAKVVKEQPVENKISTPAKSASSAEVKKTPEKKTAVAKTSAPAKKTVSPPPAAPKKYWIQVGSYEAKKSADEAREILEKNKIANEVFTYKNAKGKLFYRVRVGPYTTKSEAEYWQKRIAVVDEFAKVSSFVVEN